MTKNKRRTVAAILVLASAFTPLFSLQQLNLRIEPKAWLPFGNPSGIYKDGKNLDLFSFGYGLDLTGDITILGWLSPYLEMGGSLISATKVSGENLAFALGGGGLSAYSYPTPRLFLRAGGGGGMAYAGYGNLKPGLAYYWKAKAEAGYRFSPTFSILADAGYAQLLGSQAPIFKGMSLGLLFNIGLDGLGGKSAGLSTEIARQESVFPITYYKRDKVPIAYLRLTNGESAEIRDVQVTFSAGGYSSRPADCGQYSVIQHGASVDVPIYANFNDKVLGFSERTKIQGEVRIDYKVLDASRSASRSITVSFNDRNSATWADLEVVGAFVSPQDPVMLELSKYIAGLVRVRARPEIDKFLQYGMGLFEGLRVYGLVWSADPNLPYTAARADPAKVAYIQYPGQTLAYKSGDSDALALAVAEALESVAVPAAIAALPEDVIVAFPLDMGEAQARSTFSDPHSFIFDSGNVWVPLRASMIRDGFLRAWQAGAELWHAQPDTAPPKLVKVEESWKDFLPIALPDSDYKPIKPSEDAVNLAFESVLGRFVAVEVEPKANRILAAMKGGAGTDKQRNSLGIVYAQYGLYEKARAEFSASVALGYGPAVVNLANVSFLLKDYEAAAALFQQALASQGASKAALIGLARAKYELDAYAEADELFARVRAIDPALADRYAYLSSKVDAGEALRASSAAADRGGGMTWDSGE
jgi:tetratricopeptide (TPR) repeat protein